MEIPESVTALAKKMGFDRAIFVGIYKGEEIYSAEFNSPNAMTGVYPFIHKKGDKLRWSKDRGEMRDIMDAL